MKIFSFPSSADTQSSSIYSHYYYSSTAMANYVVEHMEDGIFPWVLLEYLAVSKDVGGADHFFLTSMNPDLHASLPPQLADKSVVTTTTDEVIALPAVSAAAAAGRVCLLDPGAEQELVPEDGDRFDWYVFGGILGDHPPRDRTAELRRYGFAGRRLGPVQMTTDTAIRVTKTVVEERLPLDKIPYVDFPELRWSRRESTEMPFRYVADANNEPIMPEGMRELIKADASRGFGDML
ncbi:SAM-dependent RNA methyltransferase [Myxozyma melibiosi]|uniref:SAM-dependent RNA methyltransferase n=1 Tax=Myxozyma melibiosi TaxID=54550 RepID=A0ABR1F4K6_9ASCO